LSLSKTFTIRLITCCFIKIALSTSLSAQRPDTSISRISVDIYYWGNADHHTETLTSIGQTERLSDILNKKTVLFVKNYGPGLAIAAFRGTAAQHTALFWEGMPVNSSSLGTLDLNLLGSNSFDKLQIDYGSAGLTQASGTFGGVLNLSSNKKIDQSHLVGIQVGSFGQRAIFYDGVDSLKPNLKMRTRVNLSQADNDYTFVNTFNANKKERLKNAEQQMINLLQSAVWNGDSINQFSINFWLQHSSRLLPPTMTSAVSGESQIDNAIRVVANWNQDARNIHSKAITLGYAYEELIYADSISKLYSPTYTQRFWQTYTQHFTKFRNRSLKLTIQNKYDIARNPNLKNQLVSQYRPAASTEMQIFASKRFASHGLIRLECPDLKHALPAGTLGATYLFGANNNIVSSVNVGYNSNYPSLNDLYWSPGGNENLKPESGPNSEFNLHYKPYKQKFTYFQASAFSQRIYNYIQWQPGQAAYWSPTNIDQVYARGFNASANTTKQVFAKEFNFMFKYSYTRSTKSTDKQQLIYIPRHQFALSLTAHLYKNIQLSCNNQFTGERRTPDDLLPMFNIVNVELNGTIPAKTEIKYSLAVNNIANAKYQVIAFRPMPSRWYGLNFSIKI